MKQGKLEQANAVATIISKLIIKKNSQQLNNINPNDSKQLWEEVRKITKKPQSMSVPNGVNANTLNFNYSNISSDANYIAPPRKEMAENKTQYLTPADTFRLLDRLKPTATGPDNMPAWFLKLSAPIIAEPIATIYNKSLNEGRVPTQWKMSKVKPIPKTSNPHTVTDYRPISITPILSRLIEKEIVKRTIYPSFQQPPPNLNFDDQYAFKPTGSTTSCIIKLLSTITNLLRDNTYVRVVALDFSKAFDSVKHSELAQKLAALDIPTNIYNWLIDFLDNRKQLTDFNGEISGLSAITAGVSKGRLLARQLSL